MKARRDALARRFLSNVLDETRAWPPHLQGALHELAFAALPELVLELDPAGAQRWARGWRQRMAKGPLSLHVHAADAEWVGAIARDWIEARRAPIDDTTLATSAQARLAELVSRLGPIAFGLPWRAEPPAKA